MALTVNTMYARLFAMSLTMDEAAAASALAEAYRTYCAGAAANGIPVSAAALTAGKAAMIPALSGMSATGAGAAKIQAGCIAFWGAVAALLAGAFTGAIAIVPPPLSGLTSGLSNTFASNTSGKKVKWESCSALAGVFHDQTKTGGTVTFPGTPPLVVPIL